MSYSKNKTKNYIYIGIIVLIILTGIIVGIILWVKSEKDKNVKKEETFKITEEHITRVSLLQQWMEKYGVKDLPELKEEKYNSTEVLANIILSINKIEINGNKGETVQIFKDFLPVELEAEEYMCISYGSNQEEHMTKIIGGQFTIPNDLETEVNETEFTFILYFNYDPAINEYNSSIDLNGSIYDYNNTSSLALRLIRRRLNIFSSISNFFKDNFETIVEKVVGKIVSTVCVALVSYLCEDYSGIIVKSIGEFACDELGEFVGEGTRKLIFNSDSKPAENYKEISYAEIEKKNFTQLPSSEAEDLRKVLEGKNKNSYKLIKLITSKNSEKRQILKRSYNRFYGDLIKDIKDELSGDFEDAVLALFYHPVDYDCFELRNAIYGLGTIEDTLIEIICNRNNSILNLIKQRYSEIYPGTNLIEDVKDDTSGNFKKILVALLEERRATNIVPNIKDCENSASLLYASSTQKKVDENIFAEIFTEKSQADFSVIEELFYNLGDKSLLQVVENKFSGDFKDGLVGIYYSMINPAMYYAKKVHKCIDGLGTDYSTLIRILVTRYEVDMPLINEIYKKLYEVDMVEDIIDDTSGDYQTLLATLATSGNYSDSNYLKINIKTIFLLIIAFLLF